MRNNTQIIYERMSRGEFLSSDSSDAEKKRLYLDLEENEEDYARFFEQIGFCLEKGDGYYYFARSNENKVQIEQKLNTFCKWIDYLDFLKTYNSIFSVGFQFRKANILEQINLNVDLKDKARHLSSKQSSFADIVEKIVSELDNMGFAEKIDEIDETYKVTSAFRYAEELVDLLTIYNEDEIPQ